MEHRIFWDLTRSLVRIAPWVHASTQLEISVLWNIFPIYNKMAIFCTIWKSAWNAWNFWRNHPAVHWTCKNWWNKNNDDFEIHFFVFGVSDILYFILYPVGKSPGEYSRKMTSTICDIFVNIKLVKIDWVMFFFVDFFSSNWQKCHELLGIFFFI